MWLKIPHPAFCLVSHGPCRAELTWPSTRRKSRRQKWPEKRLRPARWGWGVVLGLLESVASAWTVSVLGVTWGPLWSFTLGTKQARQILRMVVTPRSPITERGFSIPNVGVQRRGRQSPCLAEAVLDIGLVTGIGRPWPLPLFLPFRALTFLRRVTDVGMTLSGRLL